MTLVDVIVYLVVALVCGVLGQMLVARRSAVGYVVSPVVGLVGAMLGGPIARAAGAPELLTLTIEGRSFPILWAIVGAALATVGVAWVRRPRARSRTA